MKSTKKVILISILLILLFVVVFVIKNQINTSSAPYFIQNDTKITLEIAKTPQQRERGLMYRTSMPQNQGMIFLFDQPQMLSFWMKNTLIPLDMVFLNQNKVVSIIENAPPCPKETLRCPSYNSGELADKVIELNAGIVKKIGIVRGTTLTII